MDFRRSFLWPLVPCLVVSVLSPAAPASSASVAGRSCPRAGRVSGALVCTLAGKRLVWRAVPTTTRATPKAADTSAPSTTVAVPASPATTMPAPGSKAVVREAVAYPSAVRATPKSAPAAVSAAVQAARDRLTVLAVEPVSSFVPKSKCQLLDQVTPYRGFRADLSAGFPKVRQRLPSYGNIRALIVPVDFPDRIGADDTVEYFRPVANGVRDFYVAQSYGALSFDFQIVPNWVRMPFPSTKYGMGGAVGAGDPDSYVDAVIELTDPAIDYSRFDAVYFLVPKEMPMSVMGWGPAITRPHWTSTGYIVNGATGGADMYLNERNGVIGARWKWMAHETGHAFGLYDEDLDHQSDTLGHWSLMAQSWTNGAIEFVAWDRYLQGWLPESRITCASRTDTTSVTIEPLTRQSEGRKAVMVPLTASKILVVESRRGEGLDRVTAENAGVLVYTVDMTIGQLGGGYRTVRRPGSTAKNFADAALRPGDSVSVEGVRVTFVSTSDTGDAVEVRPA